MKLTRSMQWKDKSLLPLFNMLLTILLYLLIKNYSRLSTEMSSPEHMPFPHCNVMRRDLSKLCGLQLLIILTTFRYLVLPIVKVKLDKVLIMYLFITPAKCMKRS